MHNYSSNRQDIDLPDNTERQQCTSADHVMVEQIPLFKFPPTSAEVKPYRDRSERQKGIAAETFAEARLRMWGLDVFKTDGAMVWDLGLDVRGRVIKFQVKSTSSSSDKLSFEFVRNSIHREGPRKVAYKPSDFDISACVSLIHNEVIFQPGVHRRIHLKREQFLRPDASFASLLMSLKKIGISEGDLK